MTRSRPTLATAAVVLALGLGSIAAAPAEPAAPADHTAEDVAIASRKGDIELAATVFRPAGASAAAPVPMVLHSHGWGGSRATTVGSVRDLLDAGFGVLSFDQRGHGESGGEANVEDPAFEGLDNLAVNDYVQSLDWVARDVDLLAGATALDPHPDRGRDDTRRGDERTGPDDPVMFAIGGSYGGGYQFLNAFMDEREYGVSRLDAIAPEITWFDLNDALAPSDVVRSLWLTLLEVGAPTVPTWIRTGYLEGVATGRYPDGSLPGSTDIKGRFADNGPAWWVDQGHRLDIPALIGQGLNDNLFNPNQGWSNYTRSLGDAARERSLFVGYNGGHTLPGVLPLGQLSELAGPDACSGDGGFRALSIAFFQAVLAGDDPRGVLDAPVNLSTTDGRCIELDTLQQTTTVPVGLVDTTTLTTTAVGVPLHLPILEGPATVAGIATLEGTLASAGLDARAFVGLSKGTSPVDAQLLHNNMVPLTGELVDLGSPFALDLSAVAVDLAEGETLYLTVSALNDQFLLHGSRVPGALAITDGRVHLPVVEPAG